MQEIDQTAEFSLDATAFTPSLFDSADFSYSLSSNFVTTASNYTLTFKTSMDIGSHDGCFVKYTFPPELDISTMSLTDV